MARNRPIAGSGERLPWTCSIDLRLAYGFKLDASRTPSFTVDIFNLFNNATVLGLQYDARSTAYNTVQEIMQPRIARIGLRFNF